MAPRWSSSPARRAVHISRLANHRVERVEDEVSVGDELLVRVIAVKPDGKIDLTRKDLLPDAKK